MNQRVVITGVSKGLGRALTDGFIERGHTVWGCARSKEAIAQLQNTYSQPHQFAAIDVVEFTQVESWATRLVKDGGPPDLLINNAGLANDPAPLWEVPTAAFDAVIDVNVKGVANVIRAFLPAMVEAHHGIVVNFSSGWGRSTSPQVAPYCTSKWAIEGLTRALAQELPRGMGAIALNPGIIHTDMLETCFGEAAAAHAPPHIWKQQAVPFLLNLSPKDNGSALTVPG